MIRLKDLPVYPLFDELALTNAYTQSQVEWLLAHGKLYRTNLDWEGARLPATLVKSYQEMTFYQGVYYFSEFLPLKNEVTQPLSIAQYFTTETHYSVNVRRYCRLDELCKREGIHNLADRKSSLGEQDWRWTHERADVLLVDDEEIHIPSPL